MKTITTDPIVAEVRTARDEHAAKFGYDLKEIFRDIKERQKATGRKYVTYPSRASVPTQSTK
jgi:hypothetical protein